MAKNTEKTRRSNLVKALRATERRDEDARRPISVEHLRELLDHLDEVLEDQPCDHTMRLTTAFLRDRDLDEHEIVAWFEDQGGYCDCEVAANVGEQWRDAGRDKHRHPFLFGDHTPHVEPHDFVAVLPGAVGDREQLFDALEAVLNLPGYFGRNWDALMDCLRDFHWLEPRRIVLVHTALPDLPEDQLRLYLEVLRDAVAEWKPDEGHELVVWFPQDGAGRVMRLLKPQNGGAS